MFRIGLGFDNHRLIQGRPFLLGGVEIPSPVGEEAHSDGDVLLHALCDALLGSVGKGDIGEHFPDTDPRWKGQASSLFLERTAALVHESGYRLVNLDATILLEKVKLSPYKRKIAENIASSLALSGRSNRKESASRQRPWNAVIPSAKGKRSKHRLWCWLLMNEASLTPAPVPDGPASVAAISPRIRRGVVILRRFDGGSVVGFLSGSGSGTGEDP